jgi:hypothetical protein
MYIHNVQFAGNLVKQAGLHYTPQGTPVPHASLGVNESYSVDNQKKNDKSDRFDAV